MSPPSDLREAIEAAMRRYIRSESSFNNTTDAILRAVEPVVEKNKERTEIILTMTGQMATLTADLAAAREECEALKGTIRRCCQCRFDHGKQVETCDFHGRGSATEKAAQWQARAEAAEKECREIARRLMFFHARPAPEQATPVEPPNIPHHQAPTNIVLDVEQATPTALTVNAIPSVEQPPPTVRIGHVITCGRRHATQFDCDPSVCDHAAVERLVEAASAVVKEWEAVLVVKANTTLTPLGIELRDALAALTGKGDTP